MISLARAVRSTLALVAFSLVLSACHSLPPSKAISDLSPTEVSGYRIYQSHCAACHYPNSQRPLHGPGLQGLFKLSYLPSSAPATDENVRNVILRGRNSMPSFAKDLTSSQIDDLLAYLHTL